MEYRRFNDKIVLRLDKGEEILSSIKMCLEKENVKLGSFTGIGATNNCTIGVFNPSKKEYNKFNYKDDSEITSLVGNITYNSGVYLHAHITCAYDDGKVYGGHLLEAYISLTSEIFIDIIDGMAKRKKDDELGINKIDF